MTETNSDKACSEIFDPNEIEEPPAPGNSVEHGNSGSEFLANGSALGGAIDDDFDEDGVQKVRYSSEERENAKYPADCYSFLSLHGPFEQPKFFAFGVIVWMFQVSFLFLMVLKVAGGKKLSENEDMDNPDNGFLSYFIPSNVSSLSRITQFMALVSYSFFADDSLKDVVKAVETFPSRSKVKPGDKINCMLFSCFLRFSQGFLATIVVFLLVINTQDVVEIILNFTAVNFISGFDDVAFELAQWGKYGPTFKNEANRIEELTVPDCIYRKYDHVRYQCTILPVAALLMVMLSAIAIGQDSDNVWLTQRLRVQFQDGSLFEDFSGCYDLDFNTTSRTRKRENYVSFQANAESARFGYCQANRKWILHKGNSTDACEIPEEKRIAYSTKTYYFDVSMTFEEIWYSSSGRPLQLYFFDDDAELNEEQCGSFIGDGVCNYYFNLAEYDYDEGDCCAASCTDTFCGINTLTSVFGTEIVAGNGFPNCTDPVMKPITIRLNDVFSPASSPFAIQRNKTEPLLILDCDGQNTLMVSINEGMVNQTEKVMVADGATCMMMVKNSTIGDDHIWYVDYTVYHGDEESIETGPIIMAEGNSFHTSVTYFQRIEECFLSKLGPYINKSTVYTGSDSSNRAIAWLMKGDSKYSSCERSDFIERYALAVINFAAPVFASDNSKGDDKAATSDDEGLWITQGRHCIWRAVGCTGSVVTELNYNALGDLFSGGTIATEIGLLKNLTALSMSSFSLIGTFPTEIGQLSALDSLTIYNNSLVGTIPTEIGELTELRSLTINDNGLTGFIPSEIGELTALTLLRAYVNLLAGSIPSEIGEMESLRNVVLDGNYLSGSLPSTMGNLSSLNYFGLSFNRITGEIPSELGMIESLEHIIFDSNQLVGSVPKEVLDMGLISLGVYGNNLSNLTAVDGSVICSSPPLVSAGSEHYCDCKNQCVGGDPVEPDRCACAEAQACCEDLFTRVRPCDICEDGFEEPDKFVPELLATCYEFGRFIRRGIEQFGTEAQCNQVSFMAEEAGCRCKGGSSRFKECIICEHGVENPNDFVESLGITCQDAHDYVRMDIVTYGTDEQCNAVRANSTTIGCRCKNDPQPEEVDDDKGNEDKEAETDVLTECVVCENGFLNPDFFVAELQAECGVAGDFVRENIAIYGTQSMCDGTKAAMEEYGCVCNNNGTGGGQLLSECIICEHGLSNPDFFVAEIGARCSDAADYVAENIAEYGTASACEGTKLGLVGFGCVCNDNDNKNNENENNESENNENNDNAGPITDFDTYIDECNICENGFENEDFFVDKYQTSCIDIAVVISKNIEDYGTITACNETRIELFEAGCKCNQEDNGVGVVDGSTKEGTANAFGI